MPDFRRPLERLQPALLDRLTDLEPDKTLETRRERVISEDTLRKALRRDLTWLFSATRLDAHMDPARLAHARRSVVNFGLPALSGRTASSVDAVHLEKAITQAIVEFEPRILKGTLRVRAIQAEDLRERYKVGVEISGQLWAEPVPLELLMRTEINLESGEVEISDVSRSGGA